MSTGQPKNPVEQVKDNRQQAAGSSWQIFQSRQEVIWAITQGWSWDPQSSEKSWNNAKKDLGENGYPREIGVKLRVGHKIPDKESSRSQG